MSLQKIKENCNKFFAEKNEIYKNIMLGGEYAVQIEETVIYKGKLILSPSNMYDELPGCTWLVGIIEEITGNMNIKIVEDRKIPIMRTIISSHFKIGSLVITDGYSSYPKSVKNSMFNHEIVPHNIVFKNKKGFHTNNIENLWSQLKYEEKKKLG
ncbi:hypothetical protein DMUE_5261, partial [Dictyocoela muelleri]